MFDFGCVACGTRAVGRGPGSKRHCLGLRTEYGKGGKILRKWNEQNGPSPVASYVDVFLGPPK